jgi:hypothetical protein
MKYKKLVAAAAFSALALSAAPASAMYAPGSDISDHEHLTLAGADGTTIIGSPFVLGPTTPGKWGPPAFGTGATITWSLMATGTSCAAEFAGCTISALADFMPAGFLAELNAAFAAWSAVADVTFVQVADSGAGCAFNGAGCAGDIRIGGHVFDGPGGVLAHGFYPPANGVTAAGDIHFDVAELWKIGFGGPGFDIFQVFAHELGHALGLDHTAVPMSLMNPFYTEAFSGPQADDIAGMQFIYGAPQTAIPEPGIAALLGLSIALLGLLRRSRRSA